MESYKKSKNTRFSYHGDVKKRHPKLALTEINKFKYF